MRPDIYIFPSIDSFPLFNKDVTVVLCNEVDPELTVRPDPTVTPLENVPLVADMPLENAPDVALNACKLVVPELTVKPLELVIPADVNVP